MILGQVYELYESVDVFLYQVLVLVPTHLFKLCEGQELFILKAKKVHQVSLEGIPV